METIKTYRLEFALSLCSYFASNKNTKSRNIGCDGLLQEVKPCARHRRLGCFTLIELMIVISIISILMTMLLPALKSARDTANSGVCKNNLKQIHASTLMYNTDYDGWLPIFKDDNTEYEWFRDLEKYGYTTNAIDASTKNGKMTPGGIYDCPSFKGWPNYHCDPCYSDYGANWLILDGESERKKISDPQVCMPPSQKVIFAEAYRYYFQDSGCGPDGIYGWDYIDDTPPMNYGLSWVHFNKSNMVFIDGHIECNLRSECDNFWFEWH